MLFGWIPETENTSRACSRRSGQAVPNPYTLVGTKLRGPHMPHPVNPPSNPRLTRSPGSLAIILPGLRPTCPGNSDAPSDEHPAYTDQAIRLFVAFRI